MIETDLRSSYKMRINVRPVKHAYFIPDNDWAALKNVIQLACTQWGGIRSLILPVKADLSMAPIFQHLLKLHDPDYFVGYLDQSPDPEHDAHSQLQSRLRDLFPERYVALQQGRFYASHDLTAHTLHVLADDDLKNRCLAIREWAPDNFADNVFQAIYGSIYPGQEEYYAATIQTQGAQVALGGEEFWESQIDSEPFASVVNLTGYRVSAYEVSDWFESNDFNVVVGDDINSICMYWNLRATREAVRFGPGQKRRTLLAPFSVIENPSGLDGLVNTIRTHFPTPGMSSNLNVAFTVWDEPAKDRLRKTLSRSRRQFKKFRGKFRATHYFGREAPNADDLAGKKLTYIIGLPPRLPGSYREGVAPRLPLSAPLVLGRNEVLYEPPIGFRNRSAGSVAVDLQCEVWNRYPHERGVAQLIDRNAWFSRYGLTTVRTLADRPQYLPFGLPSEWETLDAYFRGHGVSISRSRPDDYANGVIQVLGGWASVPVLASKPAYLLLDILAVRSTKKIAQHIVRELGLKPSEIDTLTPLLQDFEPAAELKGILKTYEQLCSDGRLKSYKKQLLGILSDLSTTSVIRRGLYQYCPHCGAPDWHPLDRLSEELKCSGCGHRFSLPVEQPSGSEIRWQYRLNTLINRAMDQDVLVPILAVSHLTNGKEAACKVIGLELERDGKCLGELDYVYVLDQKLHAGECKAGAQLAAKDIDTALLALELGVADFRFCTVRQFSDEAQALIEDGKKRAVAAGYPETSISVLSGDELLGEAICE